MAIKNTSVIQGAKDDDRLSGFLPPAGDPTLVGGIVVAIDSTALPTLTLKRFVGTAALSAGNQRPLGMLFEAAQGYSGGGASGDNAAGRGFDTVDKARGGIFSVAHRPGNLFDVYDDQRNDLQVTVDGDPQNASCPFVNNENFVPGALTANVSGLLSQVAPPVGGCYIGWLHAVTGGSAMDRVLTVELAISTRQV
jgi:hypothetical protein